MKASFFVIALFVSFSVMAQDENWVNRISFNTTGNCPDSITCYTQISVEINLQALTDSVTITLIIGSTQGGNDIYNRQYLFTPSIYNQPGVTQGQGGNPVFNLGEYIITENFYVDSFLK
ncbi:MAG TPA: hypothetical protein DCQ26_01100 [Marinilabiliales bacterium]|jgi:hypothetical protein|nr:MAG: hypothetical protein A2W95_11115 [Bacteroidetes bacterium GWA2_40_14]OFX59721.1 MAG: hypothetical protein A2W84_01730 [Bacteroidetes bacterium GWC2_40_13]OFX70898.1 MAG: hypothetical protein A2W96_14100 [Bacteroidetes bacterium GWD2_40_43]OFX95698.1 MAG: hypothetical protein A2W97_06840 [Bacteroidetes bacterium GWE2_40_63]OFY21227.1 MAG: hypothetical protein A2W88_19350 [Bacteroidetes bacterium GWF2_40_13]OFZ23510.1 MAG: hypothetical protein A2437_05655 [Bacteroidetes bacterium RIFOXYC